MNGARAKELRALVDERFPSLSISTKYFTNRLGVRRLSSQCRRAAYQRVKKVFKSMNKPEVI